jgi:hypothetical protein
MTDKSDLALWVAIASACFTGGSLFYTRILARNDSKRLKRTPLSLEMEIYKEESKRDWDCLHLVIRNLEPAAAKVLSLQSKSKCSRLLLESDARNETDAYGTPTGFDVSKAAQKVDIDVRIPNFGRVDIEGNNLSNVPLRLYAKGVSSVKDLHMDWQWSDGTKR